MTTAEAVFSTAVARQQAARAARAARTPEQRRADFVSCWECDGAGGFSDWATRGPDCREWNCDACDGMGVSDKRAAEWEPAVALWNATPGTPDGDEKYSAVEAQFPNWDIADGLLAMAEECRVVR